MGILMDDLVPQSPKAWSYRTGHMIEDVIDHRSIGVVRYMHGEGRESCARFDVPRMLLIRSRMKVALQSNIDSGHQRAKVPPRTAAGSGDTLCQWNAFKIAEQVNDVLIACRRDNFREVLALAGFLDARHRQRRVDSLNMAQGSELKINYSDAFVAIGDLEHVTRAITGINAKVLVTFAAQWIQISRQAIKTLDYLHCLAATNARRITIKEFDFR
jgi:hypothetical protein